MNRAIQSTPFPNHNMVLCIIIIATLVFVFPPPIQKVYAISGDVIWRINAGSNADLTWNGIFWSKDSFFAGGTGWNPGLLEIARTSDDLIYSSERAAETDAGSFNYVIDELPDGNLLPNGTYLVRLHFAEIFWPGANLRMFDILIEDERVISDYDIAAIAGIRTAEIREFVVQVSDNSLDIEFPTAGVDRPKLSAIEIYESDDEPGSVPNLDTELEDIGQMSTSIPAIEWVLPEDENNRPIHREWYHLQVFDADGESALDQWFEDTDICTSIHCTISINHPGLNNYLANGYYTWTINTETGGREPLNLIDKILQVDMDTPQAVFSENLVDISTGRVILHIPSDANAFWYQVWLGTIDPETETLNQHHSRWYQNTADWCHYERCELVLDTHPQNDDLEYMLYIRAWGPAGYSRGTFEGGWSQAGRFKLAFNIPAALKAMTVTEVEDTPDFQWSHAHHATWYNIWIGSSNWDRVDHSEWYSALELGCHDDNQCELHNPVGLSPADQPRIWYVRSWGPGGFSTGGFKDSGWAVGPEFVIP